MKVSWARALRIVCPLGVAAFFVMGMWETSRHSSSPAMLFVVQRRGPDVLDDEDVAAELVGEARVGDDLVLAAACDAGNRWKSDRILSPDVVIASDAGLVRAAELYTDAVADGRADDASLIVQAEHAFWLSGASISRLEEWAAGLPAQQREWVQSYMEERSAAPSAAALDRFVVFAANPSTTTQILVYLDAARFDPDMLRRAANINVDGRTAIGGERGRVDFSDCLELGRRWTAFDESLPSLPPIDDRFRS